MRKLIEQMIKFGFVGFLCFFIDYGIMVLLTEVAGIVYLVSSACSFTVSVIVNYILKEKSRIKEFIVFVFLSIIGLGINQLCMWFGVELLHISYLIVKIGATAVVMVYNFISRKLIIEKKAP